MSNERNDLWDNPYAWETQKVRTLPQIELDAVCKLLGIDKAEANSIHIDTHGNLTVGFVLTREARAVQAGGTEVKAERRVCDYE